MMARMQNILITGGAGFIGSHLADELLRKGYEVRVLDNLTPQVHGSSNRPPYLSADVELRIGDMRDPETVRAALKGIDAVFHFAASVGVGQSMYCIREYTATNNLGTAVLMQELADRPIDALIVASSMSVYGEGLYATPEGRPYEASGRTLEQLKRKRWDLETELGEPLTPIPTPESKTPQLESVYALSKYDQERMSLLVGRAYGMKTVALRFFNVYGTRQALSNPYTGVLAIFSSRLLNGKPPMIFEDGEQRRDFVSVHDVVQACRLALEVPEADGGVFNIGSGRSVSVLDVARIVGEALGVTDIPPDVTEKGRVGDIRHCFADITRARAVLGYEPRVKMEEGVLEVAEWVAGEAASDDVQRASAELAARGLTI
jgi:dTDP-L-rhamnose 4-epimerase